MGRIEILGEDVASPIITFYGNLAAIRTRVDGISYGESTTIAEHNDVEELARRWRLSCDRAHKALVELEKHTGPYLNLEDEEALSTLKSELAELGED